MPPAHNALIVRLPPDAADAALADALTTAAELWWPGERHPRLWTETVPAPAGSGTAARRRAAEARRPVAPGHRLRAVLLRYAGEHPTDLVLTAGGAALDTRSLRLVARVLWGDLAPDAVTPLDGPLPLDLRMGGETRRLASALAVAVGRYEGAASVRVAVPAPARDRPPYALGALDGYAVFTADLSPGRTVADLLATEPAAPAEGDDPPGLMVVAGDADGDGPAMLPTGPDALPVPAHQVRFVQAQLASSAPNTPLSELDPLSREESAEQLAFCTPHKAATAPSVSTRSSPRRSPPARTPPRSPAAPPPSPTPNSTTAPRIWRTGCTPTVSAPVISWASACPAGPTWWRRCSPR